MIPFGCVIVNGELAGGGLSALLEAGGGAFDEQDAFEENPDVTVGGSAVADLQLSETSSEDLGRAELFAFPLLLILSLLFFRGRAAALPVVAGITAAD